MRACLKKLDFTVETFGFANRIGYRSSVCGTIHHWNKTRLNKQILVVPSRNSVSRKMVDSRPKDIDEYKKWLKDDLNIDITNKTKVYYELVATKIKAAFEKSAFWVEIDRNLREYDDEYFKESMGYNLWTSLKEPLIVYIKPFDSLLLKTFRVNILDNHNWPKAPESGWLLPDKWYSTVNDIVRTILGVKYLDGVEFVTRKFQELAEKCGVSCKVDFEAKEEGYYAAHIYVMGNYEIPKIDFDTEFVNVSVEIQITTQLQEVIRKLLHKYYEDRRKKLKIADNLKWQWDYKSDEFATNYLGHILHYVEGMIMEKRERIKEEDKSHEERISNIS
jgi:hypothetical protein